MPYNSGDGLYSGEPPPTIYEALLIHNILRPSELTSVMVLRLKLATSGSAGSGMFRGTLRIFVRARAFATCRKDSQALLK